jgi:hypothetical protein
LFLPNIAVDKNEYINNNNPRKIPLTQGNITTDMLQGPFLGKQLSDLISGMQISTTYVNIPTTYSPDGEIRGQINSANSTHA